MSESNNGWAVAVGILLFGTAVIALGRGQQTPVGPGGRNPGGNASPAPKSDDGAGSGLGGASDGGSSDSGPPPLSAEERARIAEAEKVAREEREREAEAARARVQEIERQADEARAKREQMEKEAADAKGRREEMERQASQAKEQREKLEGQIEQAESASAEGAQLSDASDKTNKAMAEADSARLGTLRTLAEGVITNVGGPTTQVLTNQVLGTIGVLEATKNTIEAVEKDESVVDPVVSGVLSGAQKAANVLQGVPVVGQVVTGVQVAYAVGKDVKAQVAADKSVDALSEQASASQNPQIAELAQQHGQAKEQVAARRDEAMREGPLTPDDDYTFVKPLLDAAHSNTALDRQLASGVKQAASEQVVKATAEAEAYQRETERLRAQEAQLQEDAAKAKQAEEEAQAEARRAAETESTLAEQVRAEKALMAQAEAEATLAKEEPPMGGGGLLGFLSSFWSTSKNEAVAEERRDNPSPTREASGGSDDSYSGHDSGGSDSGQPSSPSEKGTETAAVETPAESVETPQEKSEELPKSEAADTGPPSESSGKDSWDEAIDKVSHYFGDSPYG